MKALITGATGFIGSHLADKLLGKGYEVACLVRNPSIPGWIEGTGAKLIKGDCAEESSLRNIVKGYDYIFHLAGLVKAARKEDFYSANSKCTGNIIKAVAENNPDIKRFIYVSSLSAFGPRCGGAGIPCESEKPNPVSDYGRSKLKAEESVLEYSGKIPVSILRPAAVYGPRDKGFFVFFKMISTGFLPYRGDGQISLVYVDDLTDALVLSAGSKDAVGKTYFVSDGIIYRNNYVITEIASALNVKVAKIKLPGPVLRTIGFFSDKISKIMGKNTMINSDKIKELMYTDWVCDISNAKKDLGFEPRVGLKEGIKWTADWYRIHRWL